jgi:cytochrome c oxidase assembly protein subunit 15
MSANPNRVLSIWLFSCCAFIALMVFVGGVTRLTESGLSITEWKPVSGILPPLSEEKWQESFAKYQQIPEYKQINRGMSLADYKAIYWWEFFHRLLGRITGFVLLLPWIYFAAKGYTNRNLNLRLFGIFCLGGLQGVIGWYMVKSGLSIRTDVSQYRLAIHLTLAFLLFAMVYWQALTLYYRHPGKGRDPSSLALPAVDPGLRRDGMFGWIVIAAIFLQVFMGALVAGLDAGLTYNTFPLMDGHLIPSGLFHLSPWYLNFFENVTMVQFQHRWMAKLVAVLVIIFWYRTRQQNPKAANLMLAALALQIILGISALIFVVPIPLASAHQMGALLLLLCSLRALFPRIL